MQYAPWALFNIFNPVIAIGYALAGFKVERLAAADDAPSPPATATSTATAV